VKYEEGLKMYEIGEYSKAASDLLISFTIKPNALTAYYLAHSFYQSQSFQQASDFALEALFKQKPILNEKLRKSLYSLVKLADAKTTHERIRKTHETYNFAFSNNSESPKNLAVLAALKEQEKLREKILGELMRYHNLNSGENNLLKELIGH
jgi:hypothetical protein